MRLRGWTAFSNSSPVEGIETAIRTLYKEDKRISLYVCASRTAAPSPSTA